MRSPGLLGFAFLPSSLLGLLGLLGVIGCQDLPDKRDVARLPDAIADDTKVDSLNGPRNGGTVKVGAVAEGDFTATRGWIGYEVELTAGLVEVDLRATDSEGAELDTVLYVFGPKNETTHRYRREVLALNDDVAAGDVHSHLAFEVPENGHYRLVVSTYDNYFAYPKNVSRGHYAVGVTCPRLESDACGPSVSPPGGACLADADCWAGHHCEGEIDCEPGTMCLWVRQGACVEDYRWLTIAPRQCLSNLWDTEPGMGDGETPGYPVEELQRIDDAFESRGIDLVELGLVWPSEPHATCLACSCPRGDRLVVKARPNDVGALVALGFEALDDGDALQIGPRQCDGNPWTEAPKPTEEAANLASWSASIAAPLDEVGFVYKTTPQLQCTACACPRGDVAFVVPADPASAESILSAQGFGPLYVE